LAELFIFARLLKQLNAFVKESPRNAKSVIAVTLGKQLAVPSVDAFMQSLYNEFSRASGVPT
jgi:hypothetical protein